MKPAVWSSLLLCGLLGISVESWAQTPVGALAVGEHGSHQWGRAVDYETAAAAREAALRRVRRGMLGGADVRPVRSVCDRPGRRQHRGRVGRSVCLCRRRPAGGAGRVPFAGRRIGLHRAGVGLQRFG